MSQAGDGTTHDPPNADFTARRVEALYASPASFTMTFVFSCIIAVVFCGAAPSVGTAPVSHGLLWVGSAAVMTAIHLGFWYAYRRRLLEFPAQVWLYILAGSAILDHSIWGATAFVFWDENNLVNQALICIIIFAASVSCVFWRGCLFDCDLSRFAPALFIPHLAVFDF